MAGSVPNGETDAHPIIYAAPIPFGITPSFEITFLQRDDKDHGLQDAEVFDTVVKQRIRIHDYEIRLSYPHLYEYFNMDNPCYSRLTAFLATSSNKSSVVNPHSSSPHSCASTSAPMARASLAAPYASSILRQATADLASKHAHS